MEEYEQTALKREVAEEMVRLNPGTTLIEKILVHEATKDADGNRVQEIEIIYRFVGKID